MRRFLQGVLWFSVGAAIFLAFAWPVLVSNDPASVAFEALAKGVLVAFFASLAALLVAKARRARAS